MLSGPSFIPRFDSSSLDNSPNYSSQKSTTTAPVSSTTSEPNEQATTEGIRPDVGHGSTSGQSVTAVPQLVPPESFSETLLGLPKINTSNNLFHLLPSYSGTPGMLGVGSQIPSDIVKQQISGIPEAQYLPPEVKNATEVRAEVPSYAGFPGMKGEGRQVMEGIQDPHTYTIINQTEQYTDLETIHGPFVGGALPKDPAKEHNSSSDSKAESNETSTAEESQFGYTDNREAFGAFMSSVPGTLGLEMVPAGVNRNNWNGEWPGQFFHTNVKKFIW